MIRKQIIFKIKETKEIDYNYQHEVQSNIYKYLKVANEKRAAILHNTGYRLESGHTYKLFNFTLLFENAGFYPSGIRLNQYSTIKLIVSGKKEIISQILSGVQEKRVLDIDGTKMELVGVEDDKRVRIQEVMLYKSLSPVVTTTKDDKGNKVSLTPYYGEYFINLGVNLMRKYKAFYGKEYKGKIDFEMDNLLEVQDKFVKIKKGGFKGHIYNIWIQADKDMQKIIYYMGLGQNSSIGCGCLNYVKGARAYEEDI